MWCQAGGQACSPGRHVGEIAHLLSVPDVSPNVCFHSALALLRAAQRYRLVDPLHLSQQAYLGPLLDQASSWAHI